MQALELNCRDSWSSHCLAHVYEMKGEYDNGLSFLEQTVNDWQVCTARTLHNVITL